MRWERVVGEGSSVSHSTHRCHSHPWSPVAGDSPLYLPSSGSWLTSAEEGGGRERRENWNNHIGLGTCLDHAQSTNQILSRWCNDLIRKLLYTQCPQTLAVLSPYPSNKYWYIGTLSIQLPPLSSPHLSWSEGCNWGTSLRLGLPWGPHSLAVKK